MKFLKSDERGLSRETNVLLFFFFFFSRASDERFSKRIPPKKRKIKRTFQKSRFRQILGKSKEGANREFRSLLQKDKPMKYREISICVAAGGGVHETFYMCVRAEEQQDVTHEFTRPPNSPHWGTMGGHTQGNRGGPPNSPNTLTRRVRTL